MSLISMKLSNSSQHLNILSLFEHHKAKWKTPSTGHRIRCRCWTLWMPHVMTSQVNDFPTGISEVYHSYCVVVLCKKLFSPGPLQRKTSEVTLTGEGKKYLDTTQIYELTVLQHVDYCLDLFDYTVTEFCSLLWVVFYIFHQDVIHVVVKKHLFYVFKPEWLKL